MGFPRQEYWSELPFPSPGNLPNTGIKPESPACQVDSLPLSHLGSPNLLRKLKPKALFNSLGSFLSDQVKSESHSVMSDSLPPHGLYRPWNSPWISKNTGVDSRSLLQGIFPTQGSNPALPQCKCILYQLSHDQRLQLSIQLSNIYMVKSIVIF